MKRIIRSLLGGSAITALAVATAAAANFSVPAGDLKAALDTFSKQSGVPLMVSADILKGARTNGVVGDLPTNDALTRILKGTGFEVYHSPTGALGVMRTEQSGEATEMLQAMRLAQAAPQRAAVETVTVTSSKLGGADVQSIPIAITALSQEQLTATQTAGGPDLIKQVPNMTFTKTNFSWLQHPDSRHRHAGDLRDNRSGGRRRVQRHAVYPQSLLRTGILRRFAGRSFARPTGHALRP